jgi:peptide/nickel transport system substrate-binding protein
MKRLSSSSRVRWLVTGLASAALVLMVAGRAACSETDPPAPGAAAVAAPAPAPAAAPGDEAHDLAWARKRAAELGGGVRPEDVLGPHASEADLFHPDKTPVRPALGGRIIVHIESHPANLNYALENTAIVTFILQELHDSLLRFNWETWKNDLSLATAMQVEDTVVLKGGRGENDANCVFGKVSDGGDAWVVTSGSHWNPIAEQRIPKDKVESVMRSTVYTFDLRKDAKWHDGQPFDAGDVAFSMNLYKNPSVDCDEKRYQFDEVVRTEVKDKYAVRFYLRRQYFLSESLFNMSLCLLPSHLYNLLDPDCKDYDAKASLEKQGAYINDNPHNIQFVGLGPYKLREWAPNQYIEGEKFADYYEKDPAKAGYVDTIRWRYIDNDDSAFTALLNDEIDIFRRVKSEQYFGPETEQKAFTDKFYKAYGYVGQYAFTGWNTKRSKFQDPAVRTALARAFDERAWIKVKYKDLAVPITGPTFFLSPFYNQDVHVLDYEPEKAVEELAEAGWYDRNGDGTIDKDGEEFVIEFLYPSGNRASQDMGQKLQESYAKVGVGVKLQPLEWATFKERALNRDFDAISMAWTLPEPESDPRQMWASSEAIKERTSNYTSYADPESDRLIDAIESEPDAAARVPLWHELHARIYAAQPYLFGQTPPQKYAFSKRLHGVKLYNFPPGYRVRDMWFAEGTPGTRPLSP